MRDTATRGAKARTSSERSRRYHAGLAPEDSRLHFPGDGRGDASHIALTSYNTFPGFITPRGSTAAFTARMSSISTPLL